MTNTAAILQSIISVLEFYGDEERWDDFISDQVRANYDRNIGSEFDERGAKARSAAEALRPMLFAAGFIDNLSEIFTHLRAFIVALPDDFCKTSPEFLKFTEAMERAALHFPKKETTS